MTTGPRSKAAAAVAWLLQRKLETSVFLLGVLLRMTMSWNYDARWSYDSQLHWDVVEWIAKHKKVPYPETSFEAFHPPLYYALAAWFKTLGVTRQGMAWFSITASVLELAVIWAALELYVKRSRAARLSALALASVLAALIHLGGMVYPETLNCLLNATVMLLVPLVFRRNGNDRWGLALLVGVLLGLAMLTKISTTAVLLAIGLGAAGEFLFSRHSLRERFLRFTPWAAAVVVCVAVCGWYFARNVREYGKPFVTSFDLPSQHWLVQEAHQHSFLERRTLAFVFSWDESLFIHPFSIQGVGAHDRLIPVAVASTFVDFWSYGYQGYERPFSPMDPTRKPRDLNDTLGFGQAAFAGGVAVFIASVLAWLGAFRSLARQRDFGRLTLLLVPLATIIATFQFATAFPVDSYGVVKGIYMSFGAPPLYGLFGVAVGWTAGARGRMPLLVALVIALYCVGAYSVYCRLGIPLLPL